jgi:hypothetical protein
MISVSTRQENNENYYGIMLNMEIRKFKGNMGRFVKMAKNRRNDGR